MAEFTVRPAASEDFPAIRALIRAVRINPMQLDWRRFLVAVTPANELIGCGQVKEHADGSRELASIAVQKQARGQGVARGVIETLLARQVFRPLYLTCRGRLEPFYARFGFHVIGPEEMPPYFKRIRRLVRMFNPNARPVDQLIVMRLD